MRPNRGGVGIFEDERDFDAQRRQMIEKLAVGKIFRGGNLRAAVNQSDPASRDLFLVRDYELAERSKRGDLFRLVGDGVYPPV